MNKITFCSFPDLMHDENSIALKRYENSHIKNILNSVEQPTTFYLLEENSPNYWLKSVKEKVKITIDCSKTSIDQIVALCQKK